MGISDVGAIAPCCLATRDDEKNDGYQWLLYNGY
jgi:hypothetical protein